MEKNQLSQVLPSSNDDEIDLKELIIALWQGKLVIIFTTVICAAIAIAYALMAKQVWTTEAVITEPQVADFAGYQRLVSDFRPVFDIYQGNGTVLVSEKLDALVLPGALLHIFIRQFDSRINKKVYFSTLPEFKEELKKIEGEKNGEAYKEAESALYASWYERLSADLVKGSKDSYHLKGVLSSSELSYALLSGYVQLVASRARAAVLSNLRSVVDSKRSELEQQKILFIDQAKSRLSYEFQRSKYALEIAKAAGLDKPQQNLGDQELFAINIGADALGAKVKVLEGIKDQDLSVLEPRLQQIESKLKLLDGAKVDSDVSFKTFQFVESPEQPISRTSPKRRLIAILGVLLGGMLGCAIVLIRHAFSAKR